MLHIGINLIVFVDTVISSLLKTLNRCKGQG
jgi:hypothetical protein